MSSLNRVQLIGNVTADITPRSTQSGETVISFSLATNETWKDKNSGERKSKAQFHNIVSFNPNINKVLEKYVSKGSKIFVEGQQETRKWQDKNGQDKYITEVVLKQYKGEIVLLDGKEGRVEGETTAYTQAPSAIDDMADDIPFSSIHDGAIY
jgi:single-strand DNA-binding protein